LANEGVLAATTVSVTATVSVTDPLAVTTICPLYDPAANVEATVPLMDTISELGVSSDPLVTASQLPPLVVEAAAEK
jgi:hypothetical protein